MKADKIPNFLPNLKKDLELFGNKCILNAQDYLNKKLTKEAYRKKCIKDRDQAIDDIAKKELCLDVEKLSAEILKMLAHYYYEQSYAYKRTSRQGVVAIKIAEALSKADVIRVRED